MNPYIYGLYLTSRTNDEIIEDAEMCKEFQKSKCYKITSGFIIVIFVVIVIIACI